MHVGTSQPNSQASIPVPDSHVAMLQASHGTNMFNGDCHSTSRPIESLVVSAMSGCGWRTMARKNCASASVQRLFSKKHDTVLRVCEPFLACLNNHNGSKLSPWTMSLVFLHVCCKLTNVDGDSTKVNKRRTTSQGRSKSDAACAGG